MTVKNRFRSLTAFRNDAAGSQMQVLSVGMALDAIALQRIPLDTPRVS